MDDVIIPRTPYSADDIYLPSHRIMDLDQMTLDLEEKVGRVGSKINSNKPRIRHRPLLICINRKNIEGVEKCVYLGIVFSGYGGNEINFARRFNNAKSVFVLLSKLWTCNHLITKMKLRRFRANVFSVLLYGGTTIHG